MRCAGELKKGGKRGYKITNVRVLGFWLAWFQRKIFLDFIRKRGGSVKALVTAAEPLDLFILLRNRLTGFSGPLDSVTAPLWTTTSTAGTVPRQRPENPVKRFRKRMKRSRQRPIPSPQSRLPMGSFRSLQIVSTGGSASADGWKIRRFLNNLPFGQKNWFRIKPLGQGAKLQLCGYQCTIGATIKTVRQTVSANRKRSGAIDAASAQRGV